jgi:hypothetical protein
MVKVVYNSKYPYLGYHLVATSPLAVGYLIGYYQGIIRPENITTNTCAIRSTLIA